MATGADREQRFSTQHTVAHQTMTTRRNKFCASLLFYVNLSLCFVPFAKCLLLNNVECEHAEWVVDCRRACICVCECVCRFFSERRTPKKLCVNNFQLYFGTECKSFFILKRSNNAIYECQTTKIHNLNTYTCACGRHRASEWWHTLSSMFRSFSVWGVFAWWRI